MTSYNPVEKVVVDCWFEEKKENGDTIIHACALDGRILWITEPNLAKLTKLKEAEALLSPKPKTQRNHPDDEQNQMRRFTAKDAFGSQPPLRHLGDGDPSTPQGDGLYMSRLQRAEEHRVNGGHRCLGR